jgi:hypothetical protein
MLCVEPTIEKRAPDAASFGSKETYVDVRFG